VPFIPPMLATRLTDPARIASGRYIAEPKLDGQRAQVHVHRGRTAHVYSRPGRELLTHAGMAWLREIPWPVDSAILDGEAVAGDGHEGIQSVFEARGQAGSAMAVVLFDVLHVGGQDVMREPWRDRRKRLEDLAAGAALPGVTIVPTTEDITGLWDLWVTEGGGEGIVLKEPGSRYYPGLRSPAWLKMKAKLTLPVMIMGGSAERIAWGDWGDAVRLELAYTHPRTGARVEIAQTVRVPRGEPFELRIGATADLLCWGIMPSGMLRHPLFLRWLKVTRS
jgi:bifunctional non-homologous end joining protein LigD